MARQHVLPPVLGRVHPRTRTPWVAIIFTTVIAFGLIIYVTAVAGEETIRVLGATTALLLLAVFAVVNVAVLVLRRDLQTSGRHFTTPTALPVIGFISSLYLVIFGHTWAEYSVALLLLGIGVLLFFVTMLINRRLGVHTHGIVDPTELAQRD